MFIEKLDNALFATHVSNGQTKTYMTHAYIFYGNDAIQEENRIPGKQLLPAPPPCPCRG